MQAYSRSSTSKWRRHHQCPSNWTYRWPLVHHLPPPAGRSRRGKRLLPRPQGPPSTASLAPNPSGRTTPPRHRRRPRRTRYALASRWPAGPPPTQRSGDPAPHASRARTPAARSRQRKRPRPPQQPASRIASARSDYSGEADPIGPASTDRVGSASVRL